MSLTIGLATGLWILSFKTLQAWKRFFCCSECQAPSTQKTYPGTNFEGSQQQFLLTRPLISLVRTSNSYQPPLPQHQQVNTAIVLEHSSRQQQLFQGSQPPSNGTHYMTRSLGNGGAGISNRGLNTESGDQLYDMSWKTSNVL